MSQKNQSTDRSSFHLINWVPHESDLISEMVYRFKSNKCCSAWHHYATIAVSELQNKMNTDEIDCVVPIPGSTRSSVHAKIFAMNVSILLNKPLQDVLKKTVTRVHFPQQKMRSRAQRADNSFETRELITPDFNPLGFSTKHVLLVDDIITTGNSFRQATAALGPVNKATLMTLFCRQPKADAGLVS